jgi:peptidoglycan/xylan/chitin deacetylase (PgdA/CDA1 family)
MRLFRPSAVLRHFYPESVFRINDGNKELYLTFDDGPHPDTTTLILSILETNGVKATFFCTGQEAEKYPGLISLILAKGHIIGNHGYRHLDGWRTNTNVYIRNIQKGAELTSKHLFRPPYGRIRPSQYRVLKKKYRIVFWDLMPYDFDRKMNHERVLRVLKKKVRPGSIIVLHDNEAAAPMSFLNRFLAYAQDEGYTFRTLSSSNFQGTAECRKSR